jgi:hypothetical protein
MVNVLPGVQRKPSFGEIVGAGLGQGAKEGFSQALQRKHELELADTRKKKEEDFKFQTGLETIEAMRQIVSKGNVGRGSGILGFFGGETARDRGELEQLGTSLIPLVAAGVPVRNRQEFEKYSKIITDPSSPEDQLIGALNGLEKIFKNKVSGEEKEKSPQKRKSKGKVRFDLSNPEHRAKRDQLLKAYKGDQEKVAEILDREFES